MMFIDKKMIKYLNNLCGKNSKIIQYINNGNVKEVNFVDYDLNNSKKNRSLGVWIEVEYDSIKKNPFNNEVDNNTICYLIFNDGSRLINVFDEDKAFIKCLTF